jgi:hypothetical protein
MFLYLRGVFLLIKAQKMDCEPLTNVDNIVTHWTKTSDRDFAVMQGIVGAGFKPAPTTGNAISEKQGELLNEITKFNLNARDDDYKHNFYVLCTAEFTAEWAEIIKQLRLWIKEML